jgi:hypothetical protein
MPGRRPEGAVRIVLWALLVLLGVVFLLGYLYLISGGRLLMG